MLFKCKIIYRLIEMFSMILFRQMQLIHFYIYIIKTLFMILLTTTSLLKVLKQYCKQYTTESGNTKLICSDKTISDYFEIKLRNLIQNIFIKYFCLYEIKVETVQYIV